MNINKKKQHNLFLKQIDLKAKIIIAVSRFKKSLKIGFLKTPLLYSYNKNLIKHYDLDLHEKNIKILYYKNDDTVIAQN